MWKKLYNIFGGENMVYERRVEIIGEPSLKTDGSSEDQKRISSILSDILGLEESKIAFFIENFGFPAILEDPSIMGLNECQISIIENIKYLISFGGKHNESVRY